MAEVFKFQKKNKVYFNVDIEGTVIALPIGASMPTGMYKTLEKITRLSRKIKQGGDSLELLEANTELFDSLIGLFESVIPQDQVDAIGLKDWAVNDLTALFNAWQTSALEYQGASLGESQASASSSENTKRQ